MPIATSIGGRDATGPMVGPPGPGKLFTAGGSMKPLAGSWARAGAESPAAKISDRDSDRDATPARHR
jgi:hypothetical protein